MTEERNLFHVQTVSRRQTARHAQRYAAAQWGQRVKAKVAFFLRLSLAMVFFWFGILKFAGVSPVIDLLNKSFPFLAMSPYLQLLGLAEMMIAVGLVFKRLTNYAARLMILHLLATLGIVLVAPSLIFSPAFPVLTMEGEFIVKNLVLITAGLVVLDSRQQ